MLLPKTARTPPSVPLNLPLADLRGRRPERSRRLRNWVVRRPPSGFSMHVRLAESTRQRI